MKDFGAGSTYVIDDEEERGKLDVGGGKLDGEVGELGVLIQELDVWKDVAVWKDVDDFRTGLITGVTCFTESEREH